MGREHLHEWTVEVAAAGYRESRHVYHDANGRVVETQILVRWDDGTTSGQVVRILPDGEVTTEGQCRYPDDTHISTHFYPSGRLAVVHLHPTSQESTTWMYEQNGSAAVDFRRPVDMGTTTGVAFTYWNLNPDGSPVGDIRDVEELDDSQTNHHTQVQTVRSPDGTQKTTIKVWDENGELIRQDVTEVHPHAKPDPGKATTVLPTKPQPTGPVTDGSPVDVITTTSRLPDGTLPGGGGWVGPGPIIVEHWLDWWLETPDGRVTYIGSTLEMKTEKE